MPLPSQLTLTPEERLERVQARAKAASRRGFAEFQAQRQAARAPLFDDKTPPEPEEAPWVKPGPYTGPIPRWDSPVPFSAEQARTMLAPSHWFVVGHEKMVFHGDYGNDYFPGYNWVTEDDGEVWILEVNGSRRRKPFWPVEIMDVLIVIFRRHAPWARHARCYGMNGKRTPDYPARFGRF